jgi:hypothetical protein
VLQKTFFGDGGINSVEKFDVAHDVPFRDSSAAETMRRDPYATGGVYQKAEDLGESVGGVKEERELWSQS